MRMRYFSGGMEFLNPITIYHVVLKDACPYSVLSSDNFYGRIENQTASNIYFSLVGSEDNSLVNSLVIVPHNWIKFMAPIKVKSKE